MPEDRAATRMRIDIARRIAARKRAELGPHATAAACYGSVAHGAAAEHSDVELIVIVDDEASAREEMLVEDGVLVECDLVPAARMLTAAARVTWTWGIEADAYRHHLILWDPDDFFSRLHDVATAIDRASFQAALGESWWRAYEGRGKVLNAVAERDRPCALYLGWGFAYSAAMRIALYDQAPYESVRTLWRDVSARGYGVNRLADMLADGSLEEVRDAVENVWEQTRAWGAP